jgi:hypothetical protein
MGDEGFELAGIDEMAEEGWITSFCELDHLIQARKGEPLARDDAELRKKAHNVVPKEYHDLLDVFSKADSDVLPEDTGNDFEVKLEAGKSAKDLGWSPLYKCSLTEL